MPCNQNFHAERQQLVNRIWNLPPCFFFFLPFSFLHVRIDLSPTFPLLLAKAHTLPLVGAFLPCLWFTQVCLVGFARPWHSFQTTLGKRCVLAQYTSARETFHFCAVTPCRLADNQCPAHLLYGLWLSHSHVLGERCFARRRRPLCWASPLTPSLHPSLVVLVEGKMTICCPSCPVTGQQPSLMAQFHCPLSAWDSECMCVCVCVCVCVRACAS